MESIVKTFVNNCKSSSKLSCNLPSKLSCNLPSVNSGKKKFRILAISGGGARGIIPSLILLRLEQLTGKHTTDLFDLFIGTSTGAMICSVLNMQKLEEIDDENVVIGPSVDTDATPVVPIAETDSVVPVVPVNPKNVKKKTVLSGKPKYTAKDLLDVYVKEGPIVFESSMWRKMTTINGLYGPMFYTKNRDERFNAWMGEHRLKDLLNDCIFTSYDLCTKQPVFFKSRKAKLNEEDDYLLSDTIKASTCAPTIWSPHQIGNTLYMDALYAKNPSMFGLIEALKHYNVSSDDILLVSLGTGYSKKHVDPKNIITTGPAFLMEAFDNTINATTISVMYGISTFIKKEQILDIDIELAEDHMSITDTNQLQINYMIDTTHKWLNEHEQELIEYAKLLMA
jgi:patatin-like phospholipase/acyl hydrolase